MANFRCMQWEDLAVSVGYVEIFYIGIICYLQSCLYRPI